jgi:hypothetical protein
VTRVICDAVLREKLHDLAQPLELCDESGHVVARVVPVLDLEDDIGEPQISKDEWQRRMAQKGKTYSTAEVLAHLENL